MNQAETQFTGRRPSLPSGLDLKTLINTADRDLPGRSTLRVAGALKRAERVSSCWRTVWSEGLIGEERHVALVMQDMLVQIETGRSRQHARYVAGSVQEHNKTSRSDNELHQARPGQRILLT